MDLDEWAHHTSCETIPDNIMRQMDEFAIVSFAFTCNVDGKPIGS